jgi:capsular polysaccharide biosynthesis protein
MKDTMELDLGQLLRVLKKKAKYIFLITVIFALIGFLSAEVLTAPVYEAQAKMIVNASGSSGQNMGSDQLASSMKLVDTCAIIVRSRTVLQPIIDVLNLEDTCNSLAGKISVASVNDTPVMQVTVQYSDPEMAKAITAKILEVAPALIMESIEAGSVKTVEDVVGSSEPVSSGTVKTVVLYSVMGFVLSYGLFIALMLMDNTFHTEQDVAQMLNLPVLGVIPSVESCEKVSGNTQKGKRG